MDGAKSHKDVAEDDKDGARGHKDVVGGDKDGAESQQNGIKGYKNVAEGNKYVAEGDKEVPEGDRDRAESLEKNNINKKIKNLKLKTQLKYIYMKVLENKITLRFWNMKSMKLSDKFHFVHIQYLYTEVDLV